MNPNPSQTLDPKLQETYNQVMGQNNQAASLAPAPSETTTQPPLNASAEATAPAPQATTTPNQYTQDNLSFQAAIQQGANQQTSQTPLNGVVQQKSSPSLLKSIYLIGAIVFFVVYTFVWLRIFNLPFPF